MSESDDFIVIRLLPPSDPAVREIMERLFSVFAKHKGLDQAFSALVYLFAMTISTLPSDARERLVRRMVEPILQVSAEMAGANPVEAPTMLPYRGKYQDQERGPQRAR